MITLLKRLYWKIYFVMRTQLEEYDYYLDDILMAFLDFTPRAKQVMKLCTDETIMDGKAQTKEMKTAEKPTPMVNVVSGEYYAQFVKIVTEHYHYLIRKHTAMELCTGILRQYKQDLTDVLEFDVSLHLEQMYGQYKVEVHNVENQIHNHPDINNTKRVLKDTLDEYVNRYLSEYFKTSNRLRRESVRPSNRYTIRLDAVMKSFMEQVELTKQSRESAQQQAVQEDEFSKEQKEFDALRANLDDLMKQ